MWASFQKLLVGRYRRRLTPRTASSLEACAAPGAGGGLQAKLVQLHAAAELWEAALRGRDPGPGNAGQGHGVLRMMEALRHEAARCCAWRSLRLLI